MWSAIAFGILAGLLLLGALKVVTAQYITHAALFLAITLISVAGLFILLEAPFLAAVQVLVYVGAVIAVFVFAVMLSEIKEIGGAEARKTFLQELRSGLRSPYYGGLPFAVAGLLAVLIIVAVTSIGNIPAAGSVDTSVLGIGLALFSNYLLAFEIAGVLLLIAMVGAILFARQGGDS